MSVTQVRDKHVKCRQAPQGVERLIGLFVDELWLHQSGELSPRPTPRLERVKAAIDENR